MNITESLQFFAKQTATFEEGFAYARKNGNYHLLSLNARQVFLNRLMQALMTWRMKENPRALIEEVVDRGLESMSALFELKPEANVASAFPIEKLRMVAFLIDREVETKKEWQLIESPDRNLDYLLGTILTGHPLTSLSNAIAVEVGKLFATNRSALAAKSYQLYFDILSVDGVKGEVDGLVDEADNLYRQRVVDAFYSNGYEVEGGGLDNELIVDYRMGAVLKYLNYSDSSAHVWRW
ncbi:hypothetical protein [Pseudomonas tolaasii]|uniref:hypothetical protein n=1 Tax=Pseudomonas tolaasii TaxID=29442 RepID=UPI0027335A59|nr:hypothetical protein [Pseudomonas tolaasii]WLH54021.1 hypothetical protein PSH62_10555 [Pseudomonas tolaasii]